MTKEISKAKVWTAILLAMLLFLSGCVAAVGPEGSQQRAGTGWGAGAGAVGGGILGQVIGGNTESTLIGTVIGGTLGALLGNQVGAYMDRQQGELAAVAARSEFLSIRRDQDILHATFRGRAMFATGSAVLMPGAMRDVERVAMILAKYPQTKVMVAGHTDTRGDMVKNKQLSEDRAKAVAQVLRYYGVDSSRIQTMGFGASQPISDNHALNRRVELRLVPITAG